MGNWAMVITGVGCHHNTKSDAEWRKKNDADVQFADFVQSLKDAGHSISSASFTFGSAEIAASKQEKVSG